MLGGLPLLSVVFVSSEVGGLGSEDNWFPNTMLEPRYDSVGVVVPR